MISFVLSVVLAVFIAYSIRWRLKILKVFRENNIPGPPPRFLWGNVWEIYMHGHLTMHKKWHEEYGPVVGYFYGIWPVIIVSDEELMRQVMFTNFHTFADRSELVNTSFIKGFEKSLIVLKGQRWKEVRAMLTPSFTSKKLKEITPIVSSCVDGFMENVDKGFKTSATCDFYESYQALTLDTICKAAMGMDYGVQKDFRNSKPLRRVRAILSIKVDIFCILLVSFPILLTFVEIFLQLYFWAQNSLENPIAAFKKETGDVVKLRRSDPEKHRRLDLLQLMMDAQRTGESATNPDCLIAGETAEATEIWKESGNSYMETATSTNGSRLSSNKPKALTDGELIDNSLLVLVAGYETTSTALAFLTKMLVRFPEVQERVRAELIKATKGGKVYDFERLQGCQYTEAVIQETLRMYPPVLFLQGRIVAEDVKYGKMTFPKGINIFASTHELHHKEDVFPEPYVFRPERFLPENRTPVMVASSVAFGSGPRNCIGMRFAQMEIKVTLAKLLTKYRISAKEEPKHDPVINTALLLITQQITDSARCHLELL